MTKEDTMVGKEHNNVNNNDFLFVFWDLKKNKYYQKCYIFFFIIY